MADGEWEYRVEAVFRPTSSDGWVAADDLTAVLNEQSRKGWELVATHAAVPGEPNEGIFLIFKRRKAAPVTEPLSEEARREQDEAAERQRIEGIRNGPCSAGNAAPDDRHFWERIGAQERCRRCHVELPPAT